MLSTRLQYRENFELLIYHAAKAMTQRRRDECSSAGCSRQALFGLESATEPEFCFRHAADGMVGMATWGGCCSHVGCSKRPSYGFEGTRKQEFCAKHAQKGMVDTRNKRCSHEGCSKIPSFGLESTRKREFCSRHAEERMVNLVNMNSCSHEGCLKLASYGFEGTRKAKFCSKHAQTGMVDVRSKRCSHDGCSKQPSHGLQGTRKAELCAQHAQKGMVKVVDQNVVSLDRSEKRADRSEDKRTARKRAQQESVGNREGDGGVLGNSRTEKKCQGEQAARSGGGRADDGDHRRAKGARKTVIPQATRLSASST